MPEKEWLFWAKVDTSDNPSCVNPEHLTLGTHIENVRDKMTKGRHRSLGRGSRLTASDVAVIRERYARGGITQKQLAAEYNVTPNFMSEILRGRAWKDKA